ncbi:MAG: Stk1 family PASTA domain-containing Ser/Thr kinase, partial [Acutalibacteraceae bacterium]
MENYVGKRLDGRYEIIEIIGVGGMAVVYKAFDNIDKRIVAVKILKDEYIANEDFRRRFKNESKAIAVLSHPNIVKVFDVSYGDLLQYIVMEYVDGITLKEYIEQQGVVDTREAIYFVTQILRALQHAHDKGIVHRDIKPQNIMLISDGTIKVTDFGIARMSRSETKTMTGEAIGSVHYISPEQVKGSITDARTDIYSVGVVLYEMLTGKLPFESDNTAQLILMQIQKNPVMPREINPDIPVGLEQIIIRAMQKNQNDRYQSASEMLMDIEKYKRNPNIKFDYSYFVDKQPTKYIDTEPDSALAKPIPAVKNDESDLFDDSGEEYETESKSTKRTIGILVGVLAALIIAAVVIVAVFMPSKNKIDVPQLVGLNYTNDVMNNDDYSMFSFDVKTDTESDKDAGTILEQSPSTGKIEQGGTITLTIASNGSQTEVPDVYGYEYASAEAMLKSRNFSVSVVKEANSSVALGEVIRTSPARGEMAENGSVVTVYVSSTAEAVDVPNVIDMTVEQARKALEEKGLEMEEERRNSTEEEGKVIGQEHLGEQVEAGTTIKVYVSNGKVQEETTTEAETTTQAPTTKEETTTQKPSQTTTTTQKAT